MILTDREIKIAIRQGFIEIDPPPNETVAFSSTAVDLTLDPDIAIFENSTPPGVRREIDPSEEGFNAEEAALDLATKYKVKPAGFLLNPRVFVLAWTREHVRLHTPTRVAGRVEGRSSLARCGLAIHMTAPTIHSGFEGRIRLEMMNHSPVPIRLKPGMRICQLVLEMTLGTPEKGYQGQFFGQTVRRKRKKAA